MPFFNDISGQRFGSLVVLERLPNTYSPSGAQYTNFLCQCDCGNKHVTQSKSLLAGRVKTCGCGIGLPPSPRRLEEGESAKKILYSRYKREAKQRNLPWSLSMEDFEKLTSSNCSYCGKAPSQSSAAGRKGCYGDYIYNGIDRKDSKIGYETSNVVPCCKVCNRMKGDMTSESFIEHVSKIGKNWYETH